MNGENLATCAYLPIFFRQYLAVCHLDRAYILYYNCITLARGHNMLCYTIISSMGGSIYTRSIDK